MSSFKKTTVIYQKDTANPTSAEEILVDLYLNIDMVSCFLPGKKPGTIIAVLPDKVRYTLKDEIRNLVGGGKS